MAGQESGKQRASRIPLDYYKHSDWVQRWKLRLTAIAVVVAGAWCAASLVGAGQGNRTFSRGPVASVHAMWDNDCAACHVSFKPMGASTGIGQLIGGSHASDALCTNCHAGPEHSSREIKDQVESCAGCHRDHRGRDASLVRLADSDCTRCHANLKDHVKEQPARFENVTAFSFKQHPDFRSVRENAKDPGKLKFNHKLHMSPGLAVAPGGKPFTLADIDPSQQLRYARSPTDSAPQGSQAVQLTCASCHQLDSGDFAIKQLNGLPSDALLAPRAAGAYMQPITYDNQCKACHPLTVEPADKNGKALAVPHRLQPEALHAFLSNSYTGRFVAGTGMKLLDEPLPHRIKPGEGAEADKPSPEREKAKTAIAEEVLTAEKILYMGKQTCGECHHYTTAVGDSLRAGVVPTFRIEPPQVPDVWFKDARFNHASHKALDCKACHARAYPDDPKASTVSSDVMIPNIDNCLQCHAPASDSGGVRKGGARHDCLECHSYHHGDQPLQGLGAAARQPRKPMSVEQFLSGHP